MSFETLNNLMLRCTDITELYRNASIEEEGEAHSKIELCFILLIEEFEKFDNSQLYKNVILNESHFENLVNTIDDFVHCGTPMLPNMKKALKRIVAIITSPEAKRFDLMLN